jgi:ABC-type lipoprotein release transport system permease subunit
MEESKMKDKNNANENYIEERGTTSRNLMIVMIVLVVLFIAFKVARGMFGF